MIRLFVALLLALTAGSACAQPGSIPLQVSSITPTGVSSTYSILLATELAQSGILIDTYRLSGDADDTAAFTRACTAGVPILLGPKTYLVHDFLTSGCPSQFLLSGIPGKSVIQRNSASTSAWFHISSAAVYISGVIFDANKASVTANQWAVLLNAGGQTVYVTNSVFRNNSGSLGSGFALQSTGPAAGGSFTFEDNEVTGNTFNAAYFASVTNGLIVGNRVHDNTSSGIIVSSNATASATNFSSNILVANNRVTGNTSGISVGGIGVPYNFSQDWPARSVQVTNNVVWDNTAEIVNQGQNVDILNNQIGQVSLSHVNYGVLCNSSHGRIVGNNINLTDSSFAVDCGGAIEPNISLNHITVASGTAIDPGGTQNATVENNTLDISGTAFAVIDLATEGDGNGTAFPTEQTGLSIKHNQINLSGSGTRGIAIFDNAGGFPGATGTVIYDNYFNFTNGAAQSFGLTYFVQGSALSVQNNWVNGTAWGFVDANSSGDIVFNVLNDRLQPVSSSNPIRSIVSDYISTYNSGGSILYIYPTSQGSGYTAATAINVTCSVSGPTGANFTPLLNSGNIIGVKMIATGTGCVGTPSATASDSGGGTGAVLVASSTPVLPRNKTLIFQATNNTLLKRGGGAVTITGLTGNMFMQLGSSITLNSGFNGGVLWQAQTVPYVASYPLTSGSFTGSISGTTLTTSALTGTLAIGNTIYGPGIAAFTTITGGSGTSWTVNISQTVASEAMTSTGLPACTSATTTGSNGAQIIVTGSLSGAWTARCDGFNWIDPTGATIN